MATGGLSKYCDHRLIAVHAEPIPVMDCEGRPSSPQRHENALIVALRGAVGAGQQGVVAGRRIGWAADVPFGIKRVLRRTDNDGFHAVAFATLYSDEDRTHVRTERIAVECDREGWWW